MSTPGEQLPQFPVPAEHDAFLASLEQRELVELGNMFPKSGTAWGRAFKTERLEREREVEGLRHYVPPLESPSYDPEAGPEGFIARIRQLNTSTPISFASPNLRDDKYQINQIASRYVRNCPGVLTMAWNAARLKAENLAVFFGLSLQGIALPPRALGLSVFEPLKYKTVRLHLPGIRISDPQAKYQIRDQDITRSHIEAAKEAVLSLPHTTAFPDFFQMQPDQQGAIVAALGAEWQELCGLLYQYDREALSADTLRKQGSLAYQPVAKLRNAIEQNPPSETVKLCRFFLRDPQAFDIHLEATKIATKIKAERDKQLLAAREAHRAKLAERQGIAPESLPEVKETRAMSENLREIERLTNNPDVKDGVLDVAYGVPFPLTEQNKLIIGSEFDEIADKHIELIGRALWEMILDKNPNGVRLHRWKDFNVGAALRGGHRGYMRNLTVSLVPVTAEEMATELKNYNPETTTPENALRLIFTADMKPTGRKAEQVYLRMILTVTRIQKGRDRDIIKKNKYAARATGADVALSMRLDSEARARAAEVRSWKAPALRGGLPSVGRHETSTQQKR